MAEIKVHKNQKVVTVQHVYYDETYPYSRVSVEANMNAMKDLSPNGYKLYMYLLLNKDGFTFALSAVDVSKTCGMSENTYQKSVKELIEKGYLVKKSEGSNAYRFLEGKGRTMTKHFKR